jgi:hypothetical protein
MRACVRARATKQELASAPPVRTREAADFFPSSRFARANQNSRERGRGEKMANVVSLGSSVSLRVVL